MGGLVAKATAYGRAAIELLAGQVKELKAGDPLAPVTVLVPSNYAAVAARRALAARPKGIANVSFTTLHRLAELLGAPSLAAEGRRPISTPVLVAAVRAVLTDDPGIFAPVATHPTTEQALAAACRELAGIDKESLDALAAQSPRASDVVRIARAVRDHTQHDWYDEHDLLRAAADATTPNIGPVVLHLLADIPLAAVDLLARVAHRVNVGLTGEPDADRMVLEAHERLGVTVVDDITPTRATRIVTVSDPDEEVRATVRAITQWMRDGVALGNVAVLYATADPYARLLEEHLDAAGIARNGAPVRAAGELLFGRTVQRLLALPDRDFRRSDVVGLFTSSLLRDVPGRAWDRISREAGVVRGDDWTSRLDLFTTDAAVRAQRAKDDGYDGRARGLERDIERTTALQAFVAKLRTDLVTDATTWRGLADWVTGLVDSYLGSTQRWPVAEISAAERVEAAIERLAGLDVVDPNPTVDVFRRTLEAELDSALRRVGKLQEGVLVGHVSMANGLVLERVVVLGLAEGSFPARRLDDSLLPDAERAAAPELRLRADRLHDDHRHLRVALASADESLVLFPRGDLRRNGERAASRWLLDDAAHLAGVDRLRTAELEHTTADWLANVPSYVGALTRLEFPTSAQEHRLATIARGGVVVGDPMVDAADEVIRARRSNVFTRFDGNLASVAAELPVPGRTSASGLQKYAQCPHAYFLERILRVEVAEEPTRRIVIDALDRGSLVHEILERFVAGNLGATTWDDGDLLRLDVITAEVFDDYLQRGLTGRGIFWDRDSRRIAEDLRTFVERDRARLESGYRPLAAEHPFSSVPIALPNGRTVEIGGSIDRVDRNEADGSLHVIDYKTGSVRSNDRGLCEEAPHDHGKRLQLFLYGQVAKRDWPGATDVRGDYWFPTDKGGFQLHGYWLTPEAEASVAAAIGTIVDGIAAGVFPARPSETPAYSWVDCHSCTPDSGSDRDRRRDWERKRTDPALVAYAKLSEDFDADAL